MTSWPLVDTLVGIVVLAVEVGAALAALFAAGLKAWAARSGSATTGNGGDIGAVVPVVAVTGTVGAGFRWVGLPVAAWIQFAAGGAVVLLALFAEVSDRLMTAWRRRHPPRREVRTDFGYAALKAALPEGSIILPEGLIILPDGPSRVYYTRLPPPDGPARTPDGEEPEV